MKKNEFKIYTSDENSLVPKNTILIQDKDGWTFMTKIGVVWYVNSTAEGKDIDDTTLDKFIKKILKAIKEQKKLI